MASSTVNVLVASPLEPEHAARIEAADPRVSVLYEPGLLPVPRYAADHNGVPRDAVRRRPRPLGRAARAGRRQLRLRLAGAGRDGGATARGCAGCRAPARASAGSWSGPAWPAPSLVFTTAAGVHGTAAGRVRAAGRCCTSPRACPALRALAAGSGTGSGTRPASWRAAARCWSAWAAWAGRWPRLLAAAGVEVTGAGPDRRAPRRARGASVRRPTTGSDEVLPGDRRAGPGLPADRPDPRT